jgi:hypothetical protein
MRSKLVRKKSMVLAGMFDTVRPNSKYPQTFEGLPEDMDDWGCSNWKDYYNRNKTAGGKSYAVTLVSAELERVGGWADVHLCKYDCEFVKYFRSEGIAIGHIISNLFCSIDNVAAAAENTTDSVNTVSKIISNPLVIIAGLGLGGYIVYNKFIK